MSTLPPTPIEPMPCQGSTLGCLLCGLALVAVFPVSLWVLADPILGVAVGTSITAAAVALVGMRPRD